MRAEHEMKMKIYQLKIDSLERQIENQKLSETLLKLQIKQITSQDANLATNAQPNPAFTVMQYAGAIPQFPPISAAQVSFHEAPIPGFPASQPSYSSLLAPYPFGSAVGNY